jgi:hypothetical protein
LEELRAIFLYEEILKEKESLAHLMGLIFLWIPANIIFESKN